MEADLSYFIKVREVFLRICEGVNDICFEEPLLAALEASIMLNNMICLVNFIKTWQVIMVLLLYFRYLSFPSLFDNYSISQQFWQGKYSSLVV